MQGPVHQASQKVTRKDLFGQVNCSFKGGGLRDFPVCELTFHNFGVSCSSHGWFLAKTIRACSKIKLPVQLDVRDVGERVCVETHVEGTKLGIYCIELRRGNILRLTELQHYLVLHDAFSY